MSTRVTVAAIVPAAGASIRFGSAKLLADVDGRPLLAWTLASLLEAHVDRVVVVTAPGHQLAAVLEHAGPRVTIVTNPDPARGMFSSIQTGLEAVEAEALLVLPADMPFVPSPVIDQVARMSLATDRVVVPVHGVKRGHPVAIPGRCREGLLRAPASSDLKSALLALTEIPALEVQVDAPDVLRDVDVPGDLERPLP